MSEQDAAPNPGSTEAIERGCTCPRIDNHYGRGMYVDGAYHWWRRVDCPLHGTEMKREEG